DAAIQVTPNYSVAVTNRSSYENKRDDDRVIQEVNQTIKSNAMSAMASANRADLFLGKREYKQAIKLYDQALKLQPANFEALNARCTARLMVGDAKAALEDCNEALRIQPASAAAF